MINITCYIGVAKNSITLTMNDLRLDNKSITDYFRIGSTIKGSSHDINLKIDISRLQKGNISGDNCGDYELNEALESLLPIDGAGVILTNTIGLIFANRFKDTNMFGLMFDTGGFGGYGGGESHREIQRQGGAVFVDAINESLQNNEANVKDQIVFTAIHELGHVFNLWHIDKPTSFMTQSEPGKPYNNKAYHFDDAHVKFLARCSSDEHVRPGGKYGWGERGGGYPGRRGEVPTDAKRRPSGIEMRIDIQPREFFRFEPIQMDLLIRLKPGTSRSKTIPREVDPGYDNFIIWITDPNGERRRYKPTAMYCKNFQTIDITQDSPYNRDITVFGQRGGYTFHETGVHRIQAELRLSGYAALFSDEIEVNVLSEDIGDRACKDLRTALTVPSIAKMMFYKAGDIESSAVVHAKEIVARHHCTSAAAGFHYAFGRAVLRRSENTLTERQPKKDLIRMALLHLNRALDHQSLSSHRKSLAMKFIEDHRERRRPVSDKERVSKSIGRISKRKKREQQRSRRNRRP